VLVKVEEESEGFRCDDSSVEWLTVAGREGNEAVMSFRARSEDEIESVGSVDEAILTNLALRRGNSEKDSMMKLIEISSSVFDIFQMSQSMLKL